MFRQFVRGPFLLFLIFPVISSQIPNANLDWCLSDFVTVSEPCREQLHIVCSNFTQLWKLFDASSKYPVSGLFYSSPTDFGNYDECINFHYKGVKGKYCPFSIGVVFPFEIHSDEPKFKNVATGLSMCIPDKCTVSEIQKAFLNLPIIGLPERKLPCMQKDSNSDFQSEDIAFLVVLSIIFFLVVASTIYDFIIRKLEKKPIHPLSLAFSFLTNGEKMLKMTTSKSPEQIECLNGIRFISMMWVISGHGFVALEIIPLINKPRIETFKDEIAVMYAAGGPIAVDSFFFLSGFLLCYGYLKSMTKVPPMKQVFGIPIMIVHRYLRLTPALAMVYFTVITIFRMMGNGPLWSDMAYTMKEQCERNWWPFFLYIQNYNNYNDICLNHTWYLSADMQMFILAPLVLIPLTVLIKNDKTKLAIGGLLALIFICVVFPMAIRFGDHSIDNVYDTHSRFDDYLVGVLLAVVMRDPKLNKFPFGKLANFSIWCFVFVTDLLMLLWYHSAIRVYTHTNDTLFYGLYRPWWSFSLFWMIFSCYHGRGGIVNWILSLPVFQIGARISYCMYLLHAVIQMYYVGLARTKHYYNGYMEFYLFCGHFVVTMIISAIWSLAFESPMIIIEKAIFGQGKPRKPTTNQ